MGGLPGNDTAQPGAYSSNGEQIFFSGVGHNGLIGRSATFGPGMMGGTGCASCHGADGAGGQFVMMRRTYDAPDITYAALTAPHTSHEGDSEPAWTESDIRAAIRDGIEPSGDTLDPIMPRWNMDDQDMADLIGYLKELSAQ
jgi:mono/diheme cytochrome c family protein